jgi:hypothetical protein
MKTLIKENNQYKVENYHKTRTLIDIDPSLYEQIIKENLLGKQVNYTLGKDCNTIIKIWEKKDYEETGTITFKEIKIQKPTPEFTKDLLEFKMPNIEEEELRLIDEYKKNNEKPKPTGC